MNGKKNGPDPFTVQAEKCSSVIIRNMIDKFSKSFSYIFHTAIMIQMVIFDIGHYGDVIFKFQKGAVAFIGFGDDILSFTADRIPMDIISSGAQHDGRVHGGFVKICPNMPEVVDFP